MAEDTIVAPATPPGRGGVGIIRISGDLAYAIAMGINDNTVLAPRRVTFCSFYHNTHELVDQGLMLYFKSPHSFTGEDVVELQAHGSPIVMDMLLQECIHLGARLAEPGEFSRRAFLNGKIDLTQAEAIADIIQANTKTAAKMALLSLQGEFSQRIHALNDQLIYLRTYVEAAIDFPEEDNDYLHDGNIANQLAVIIASLKTLRAQANQGMLLREGISVVIAGRPNAGKSTLINCLSGKEVAIVTEIAGTTRDVMREHIVIDDLPVHIIDTAGIRPSDCIVEQEGIKRAWQALQSADCVLLVIAVNGDQQQEDLLTEIQDKLPQDIPIITVFNKIDTMHLTPKAVDHSVYVSAKNNQGIDNLKKIIKKVVGFQPIEGLFLARRRHKEALDKAQNLLETGQEQLILHRAGELLAEDLRLAHQSLCEITGQFSSDDLLGKIFSSFCIGK